MKHYLYSAGGSAPTFTSTVKSWNHLRSRGGHHSSLYLYRLLEWSPGTIFALEGAIAAAFTSTDCWNEALTPSLLLRRPSQQPLPVQTVGMKPWHHLCSWGGHRSNLYLYRLLEWSPGTIFALEGANAATTLMGLSSGPFLPPVFFLDEKEICTINEWWNWLRDIICNAISKLFDDFCNLSLPALGVESLNPCCCFSTKYFVFGFWDQVNLKKRPDDFLKSKYLT